MYNKVKWAFWLSTAIFAIVYGVLEIVSSIVLFFIISSLTTDQVSYSIVYGVSAVVSFGLGLALIILGVFLCEKPKKIKENEYKWNNGGMITILVFSALLMLGTIISATSGAANVYSWIFSTIALGISTTALLIHDKSRSNLMVEEITTNNIVDNIFADKINELKKLKELHVITDEQFAEASQKLFDEYKEKL